MAGSTADFQGRSILVAEDEFYLAMEIRDEIERNGATVVGPVADLTDALRALDGGDLDCAVVDINLGAGPSYELADALEALRIPFVFLTGYDSEAIPSRFDDIDRLQKPASLSTLLHILERMCNR